MGQSEIDRIKREKMMNELKGQVCFASGKTSDYDIWTLDLESGEINQLTFGSYWNDKPHWSPDGKWVVFTSNRTGYPEVFKVSARGGEAVQLTELNRWCDCPRFSPDGSRIAFISNEAGNNDMWVMDSDGNNRMQLTSHEGSDTWVDWTPDGKGLLWSSDRDDNDADIWYWDLSSGEFTQLTTESGADFNPVASPCGMYIAFVSDRQLEADSNKPFVDRDKDVWLMRADGSNPVRLTKNQGCDFCICWSPCGTNIMYASNNDHSNSHLRVMDLSGILQAFESGDDSAIETVASRIRNQKVAMDRSELKAEIGAHRNSTFVTSWMPETWVKACYPAGFFGLERFPNWVDPTFAKSCTSNTIGHRTAKA